MKDVNRCDTQERNNGRRRFLGLLGGAGALGLALAFLRERRQRELSLKEADFYRDHDLGG
jgi:hypothetical protein